MLGVFVGATNNGGVDTTHRLHIRRIATIWAARGHQKVTWLLPYRECGALGATDNHYSLLFESAFGAKKFARADMGETGEAINY